MTKVSITQRPLFVLRADDCVSCNVDVF